MFYKICDTHLYLFLCFLFHSHSVNLTAAIVFCVLLNNGRCHAAIATKGYPGWDPIVHFTRNYTA